MKFGMHPINLIKDIQVTWSALMYTYAIMTVTA